jgi:hypothetical protein
LVNLIKQFDQVAHTYIQILQAFAWKYHFNTYMYCFNY